MIDIKCPDYKFLSVITRTGYNNGAPATVAEIDVSYDFKQKWDLMETMLREWEEQKRLINSNPAVRASYEQYQQMCALAKEAA
jgi:hypothetical protein